MDFRVKSHGYPLVKSYVYSIEDHLEHRQIRSAQSAPKRPSIKCVCKHFGILDPLCPLCCLSAKSGNSQIPLPHRADVLDCPQAEKR